MPRAFGLIVALALSAAGCNEASKSGSGDATADAKIRANLDKLPAEDRALAEQQKFCASETDQRLGSMGVPIKVMVKGEPVFICCKGCEKDVQAKPDETLATVKRMKEQNPKKE